MEIMLNISDKILVAFSLLDNMGYQEHACVNSLQWRFNERDGVSNHRRLYCLHNRLFRRRPKKTHLLWGESPRKRPVLMKMFPFDDVIMLHLTAVWWTRDREKRSSYNLYLSWSMIISC